MMTQFEVAKAMLTAPFTIAVLTIVVVVMFAERKSA